MESDAAGDFASPASARAIYQPVTALFQFMVVEIWPSVNRGVMDSLRHPKLGYYVQKQGEQVLDIAADSGKKVVELPVTPSRPCACR